MTLAPVRHHWTPEDFEKMRLYYDGHKPSIDKLASLIGASRMGVKAKAIELRLTKRQKPPDWTDEEFQKLAELTPIMSPGQIARRLHRTLNAVKVKQFRMGFSKQGRAWYTIADLVELLCVNFKTISCWIQNGELKAARNQSEKGFWKITPPDLRTFIINNPLKLQGHMIDMVFLVDLLTNYHANGKDK